MRSFHQSRGRILFEVFCALVVAASCAAAWMQTGAWALLPVALVALLHGVVHAFDLAGREPPVVEEPQRIDFATEQHGGQVVPLHPELPSAEADPQLSADPAIDHVKLVDPPAPRASKGRRVKSPQKKPKQSKATEHSLSGDAEVAAPVFIERAAVATALPLEETSHPPLAPLFEPEPLARQQRPVFGRKAG